MAFPWREKNAGNETNFWQQSRRSKTYQIAGEFREAPAVHSFFGVKAYPKYEQVALYR